ncbi:HEAT repeat domain-containing protein, partial [bacterium]|nr:HEAT repeat domain-containing protein [bacterium]
FSALKNSLKDESEQVRINAIEALSNLDDNRVEEVLYNCLFDKSEEVLKNVVIALYNISGDDIFEKILNDSSLPEITLTTTKDIIKELNESDDEI